MNNTLLQYRLSLLKRTIAGVALLAVTLSSVGPTHLAAYVFSIPAAEAAEGIYAPIAYQGKLRTSAGPAATDGTYNMRFRIYNALTGGTALWTETRDGANRVTMTGGLFSVYLGEVTPLSGIDFNDDALYLQVEFDPGNDDTYEEVFAPRRRFSAVPYAHNADTVDGVHATSFIRADTDDTATGSITFDNPDVGINVTGTASGAVIQATDDLRSSGTLTVAGATQLRTYTSCSVITTDSNGNLGCGTSTVGDLTQAAADARYVNAAGDTMTGALYVNDTTGAEAAIETSGTISGAGLRINNASSAEAGIILGTTSTAQSQIYHHTGNNSLRINNVQAGDIRLQENGSDTLIINGGDSSVNGAFTVNGANNSDLTQAALTINNTATAAPIFRAQDNATDVLRIEDGGNVGIGVTNASTKLQVAGGITGSSLRLTSLTSCAVVITNSDGTLSCGSGETFNQSATDARYVNVSGDTMTGALVIDTAGVGLEVTGTVSGSQFFAHGSNVSTPGFAFVNDPDTGIGLAGSDSLSLIAGGTSVARIGPSFLTSAFTGGARINFASSTDESAPDFTFNGDTDTGLFQAATNALGFTTNGSEALRIDAGGNVGIGTTAAETALDVVGAISGSSLNVMAGTDSYILGDLGIGTTSPNAALEVTKSDTNKLQRFNSLTHGHLDIEHDGTNWRMVLNNSAPDMQFITSGGDFSFLVGNVGIGTATPGTTLDVAGGISGTTLGITGLTDCALLTTNASGTVVCSSIDPLSQTATDARYVNISGDTMTGALNVQASISGSNIHASSGLSSSGNLNITGEGIFTKNVSNADVVTITGRDNARNLVLAQTNNPVANYANSENIIFRVQDAAQTSYDGASIQGIYSSIANGNPEMDLRFATRDESGIATRLTITSTGSVGIGTTAPTQQLEVDGNILVNNTSGDDYLYLGDTNSYIRNTAGLVSIRSNTDATINPAGSEAVRVKVGGNVGIGTSTPDAKLDVNGSISGTTLGITALTDCALLITSSNGTVQCSSIDPLSQAAADARYVNIAGDTMTGALNVQANISGSSLSIMDGNATFLGDVGIGTDSPSYKFHVSTSADANNFVIADGTGRIGLGTTTLNSQVNIGGDRSIDFQGGAGSIRDVNSITTDNSGADRLTVTAGEVYMGGGVGTSKLSIVPQNTSATALGLKQLEGGVSKVVSIQTYGGTETMGLTTSGFTQAGAGNGLARFEMLHTVAPSSADGDGVGITLKTENVSGTATDVAYIDTVFDDISANQASLRFSVKDDSSSVSAPTELMRIEGETGNVGIGTSTPGAKLDVSGSISGTTLGITALTDCALLITSSNGTVQCSSIDPLSQAAADARYVNVAGDTMTGALNVRANISGNTLSIMNGGDSYFLGNVGFGTDKPDSRLHIVEDDAGTANATADDLVIENSGGAGISILGGSFSTAGLHFGDSGNALAGGLSYSNFTDSLAISTNGSTSVVIDSSSRMAVGGDLTPDYRLELSQASGNGYFGVSNSNDGDIFEIDSSGNVGIGSNTPEEKLDVVGTISGSQLSISSGVTMVALQNCSALETDSSGNVVCGTDDNDNTTYEAGQGLTLNGTVFVVNANLTGSSLSFTTISGGTVHASSGLTSSGGLVVEGTSTFNSSVVLAALTNCTYMTTDSSGNVVCQTGQVGDLLYSEAASWFVSKAGDTMTGALVINDESGAEAALEVIGTLSGEHLQVTGTGADPILLTNAAGYVGIGNDNPEAKLHIRDTVADELLRISKSGGSQDAITFWAGSSPTEYTRLIFDANEALHWSTVGDMFFTGGTSTEFGFGTTTPTDFFEVEGPNTGSNKVAAVINQLDPEANIAEIKANGVDRMVVTYGGDVGIGTTAPSEKLDVVGTISGSQLSISSGVTMVALQNCSALETDSSGNVVCGTDDNDNTTYEAGQGLTLNGTVFVVNANLTGSSLSFTTISGGTVHASSGLTSSGGLVVEGTSTFNSSVVLAALTNCTYMTTDSSGNVVCQTGQVGDLLYSDAASWFVSKAGDTMTGALVINDESGAEAALEVIGTLSGSAYRVNGVGLSNGYFFGDGDSGFYEAVDDQLRFRAGGTDGFLMTNNVFGGGTTGGPRLINEAASALNPTLLPDSADSANDTGIGSAGEDILSLIAGGSEVLRLTQNDSDLDLITANGNVNVTGSISGTSLELSGLTNCDVVITNSDGTLSCGSGETFNQAATDARYVNTSGDTMTGALVIDTTGIGLEVTGIMSGEHLQVTGTGADPILFTNAVGNVGIGTSNPQAALDVRGAFQQRYDASTFYDVIQRASGIFGLRGNGTDYVATYDTQNIRLGVGGGGTTVGSDLSVSGNASIGENYFATAAPTNGLLVEGNVGIGTTSPTEKLDVVGTISGSQLNISSGVTMVALQNCSALETDSSGNVVCGTDDNDNTTYEAGQGLTLNGTVFVVNANLTGSSLSFTTISGGTVHASSGLTSSGGLVVEGTSTFNSSVVLAALTNCTYMTTDSSGNVVCQTGQVGDLLYSEAASWFVSKAGDTMTGALNVQANISGSTLSIMDGGDSYFLGDLGVGTTSPNAYGGANRIVGISSAGNTELSLESTTGKNYVFVSQSDGDFYLVNEDDSTFPLFIDAGGNVGIDVGSGVPSAKLEVGGSISGSSLSVMAGTDSYFLGNLGIGTSTPNNTVVINSPSTNQGLTITHDHVSAREWKLFSGIGGMGHPSFAIADGSDIRLAINNAGSIGMGTTAPETRLDVVGTISGSQLNISSGVTMVALQNCTALETDSSGNVVCGTDDNDNTTYEAGQGLTLTSTVFEVNANLTGSSLSFTTISGATLHAQDGLTSSGTLVVEGAATFKNSSVVLAALTNCTYMTTDSSGNLQCQTGQVGDLLYSEAASWFVSKAGDNMTGALSISANGVGLSVQDTISGANVQVDNILSVSGSLFFNQSGSVYGAGLTECTTSNQALQWNATTGRFECAIISSVPDDYVGYWKFDETSSGTFADSSGNGNYLSGEGSGGSNDTPQPSTSTPDAITFSDPRSLDFDGTDDYGSGGDIDLLEITGDLTLSLWINYDTLSSASQFSNALIANGGSTESEVGNFAYYLNLQDTKKLRMFWEYSAGTNINFESTAAADINAGQWYHVLVTRDSSAKEVTFFIDGEQLGDPVSYSDNPTGGTTSEFRIGTNNPVSHFFDGKIDDVRVYSRVLSTGEITTFGSNGTTQNQNDERYVNVSGDTMSGALNVQAEISGATLRVSSGVTMIALQNCTAIETDSNGNLVCGSDTDTTYSAGQGLGLAGTVFTLGANLTGSSLSFTTISGATLHAQNELTSSGTLIVEGAATFNNSSVVLAALTNCTYMNTDSSGNLQCQTGQVGNLLYSEAASWFVSKAGDTMTGALVVLSNGQFSGTLTGSLVQATTTLASSGNLIVEGTTTLHGNLLPGATNSYDLGSDTQRWRDLYLSGSSIHMGTSGDEGILGYDDNGDRFTIDADGDGDHEFRITDIGSIDIRNTDGDIPTGSGYARIFARGPGASSSIAGNDSGTTLLLHLDSSNNNVGEGKTNSNGFSGGCANSFSTTTKKFGTASWDINCGGYQVYRYSGGFADDEFVTGDFTVDFWVYEAANTGVKRVLATANTFNDAQWIVLLNDSNQLQVDFQQEDNTIFSLNNTTTFPTDQWVHVAIERSGNTFRLYQDGAVAASTTNSSNLETLSTHYLMFGNLYPFNAAGYQNFTGYLDEVRISKTARFSGAFTPETGAYDSDNSVNAGLFARLSDGTLVDLTGGSSGGGGGGGDSVWTVNTDNSIFYNFGNVAIGMQDAETALEVLGTVSGSSLHTSDSITSSGNLVIDKGAVIQNGLANTVGLIVRGDNVTSAGSAGSLSETQSASTFASEIPSPDPGMTAGAWSNPGNAASSDDAFATVEGEFEQEFLKATNFGFGIPTGEAINGIEVLVERKSASSGTTIDYRVELIKGGTIGGDNKAVTNEYWPNIEATRTYGNSTDLWGRSWTAADINSSNFGVAISPEGDTNTISGGVVMSIDHIQIKVYYSDTSTITVTNLQEWQQADGTVVMSVDASGGVIINEASENTVFRVEGGTDANLIYTQGSSDRVGIGTSAPNAKLDVVGTISGAQLRVSSGVTMIALQNCSALETDANGSLVCGTDDTSNNQAGQGLALSGVVFSVNANLTGSSLSFTTISGGTLHAEELVTSSGGLVVEGSTTLNGALDVRANVSGSTLHASSGLTSSGGLVVEDTATFNGSLVFKPLTNCTYLNTDANGNLQCQTGQVGDLLYSEAASWFVSKAGDTMTGALNVQAQISGATLHASSGLTSSGKLVVSSSVLNISGNGNITNNGLISTFGSINTSDSFKIGNSTIANIVSNQLRLSGGVGGVALSDSGGNPQVVMLNTGDLGIGTTSAETKLEVVGTISGASIHAQDLLTVSGSFVLDEAGTMFGAGLSDCDGTNQTVQWDATSGQFSCVTIDAVTQTAADARYVEVGGDTMTGVLNVQANISGTSLHVSDDANIIGNINISGSILGSSTSYAQIGSIRAVDGNLLLTDHATASTFDMLQFGGTFASYPGIKRNGNQLDIRLADDSDYASINASGATFTANVGIGTSAPTVGLEVVGTISGSTVHAEDLITSSGALVIENNGIFNGNIGIGTGSPSSRLHIVENDIGTAITTADDLVIENSGGAGISILGGSTSTSALYFGDSADTVMGGMSYNHSADSMTLSTNDNTSVVIDSNSRMSVGIHSNPAYRLELYQSSGNGYFGVSNTGEGDIFEIDSAGNVGIGSSSPTEKLEVIGTVSGTTLFAQDLLAVSGALVIEESGTIFGAGLTDCDGVNQAIQWNSSTGQFGCTTISGGGLTESAADARYVNTSGDTMTGALNVQANVSGSSLHVSSGVTMIALQNCSALETDANGSLVCGTDDDTDTNTTYSAGQGLALNGTVFSLGANLSGTSLDFQTISGGVINVSTQLAVSGALIVDNNGSFYGAGLIDCQGSGDKLLWNSSTGQFECGVDSGGGGGGGGSVLIQEGDTTVVETGSILDFNASDFDITESPADEANISLSTAGLQTRLNDTYVLESGDTMVGGLLITPGGLETESVNVGVALEAIGTVSGSTLHAQDTLSTSGGLVIAATGNVFGAGLTDCDGVNQAIQWDATTGQFSCTTISGGGLTESAADARYVNTSGDTMTGALNVRANISGSSLAIMDAGESYILANLGIGVSDPAQHLHVHEDTTNPSYLLLTNDATGNTAGDGFSIAVNSAAAHLIQRENAPLDFQTNDTQRMRLSADGNLGIATTSPGTRLEVNGGITGSSLRITSVTSCPLLITDSNGTISCSSIDPLSQTAADSRYVQIGGDTMTGNLAVQAQISGASLVVSSAVTMVSLQNCTALETDGSGNLVCGTDDGGVSFGAGKGLTLAGGTTFELSDTITGTSLEVVGVASGLHLFATDLLASSGAMIIEGNVTLASLMGCSNIQSDSNGLLSCNTTDYLTELELDTEAELEAQLTDVTNVLTNNDNSDSLTEGSSNLYLTNERVDDRVDALLQQGSNITLTYNDGANTLTIAATDTNTTYEAGQGLGLNGSIFSLNTNLTGSSLSFTTISGGTLHAEELVTSSGGLVVEGSSTFNGSLAFTTLTNCTYMTTDSSGNLQCQTGTVGDLTQTAADARYLRTAGGTMTGALNVQANVSGSTLHVSSGVTMVALQNCSALETDANGSLICGTDDTGGGGGTYYAGQGLALNGTVFSLGANLSGSSLNFSTISGASIHAQDLLTLSGALVIEETGSMYGAGLSNCTNDNQALQWSSATGQFSCVTIDSSDDAPSDYVGYWKLDETIAGSFSDSSGNEATLTGNGAGGGNNTPQPNTSVPNDISFYNPRSLEFDGTDDYADAGDIEALEVTGDLTLSIWFNYDALSSASQYSNALIANGGNSESSGTNFAYYLNMRDTKKPLLFWEHGSGNNEQVEADTAASLDSGTWYHLVATRDVSENEVRFYINGTQLGGALSYTNDPDGGTTSDFRIGANNPLSHYWDGKLDDVRVYNRVLTGSEITALSSGEDSLIYKDTTLGRVGIGTSNPKAKLEVETVAGTGILIDNNDRFGAGLAISMRNENAVDSPHILFGYKDVFDVKLYKSGSDLVTNGRLVSTGVLIDSDSVASTDDLFMIRSNVASNRDKAFRIQANGATFSDNAYSSAGADYAEWFYSDDQLVPGDVVCIDITRANAVKRCTHSADGNLMGIVSTNPAFIGNTITGADGLVPPNYYLIGLIGQVPTTVTDAGGAVRPGDALTSATGGLARRAAPGEPTVGVALEGMDGKQGTVNVLISRRNSSVTVETVESHILETVAAMEIEDEVELLISDAMQSLQVLSAISGAVIAQFEALSIEQTIREALDDYTRDIGAVLSGSSLNLNVARSNKLVTDSLITAGNAIFASDVNIAGAMQVRSLSVLEDVTVGGTVHTARLETDSGATIRGNAVIDGQLIVGGTAFDPADLVSISGSALDVASLTDDEALTVLGDITIEGMATFSGSVVFAGDVLITGTITNSGDLVVNRNQAGFALIPATGTAVTVLFDKEFTHTPVVTATSDDFAAWRLREQNSSGFTIELKEPAENDIRFSWHALLTDAPNTVMGNRGTHLAHQVEFTVDQYGYPLSSSEIWNKCIRNQVVLDENGQPYSCRRYHSEHNWTHPDLLVEFFWDPESNPRLVLPDGYYVAAITVAEPVLATSSDDNTEETAHAAAPEQSGAEAEATTGTGTVHTGSGNTTSGSTSQTQSGTTATQSGSTTEQADAGTDTANTGTGTVTTGGGDTTTDTTEADDSTTGSGSTTTPPADPQPEPPVPQTGSGQTANSQPQTGSGQTAQ